MVQSFLHRHAEEGDTYLQLTKKEVEIVALTARGYGNKDIADKLFFSVKTVESYKAKIMTKLGLKSRPELVDYAIKKKLLQL